LDVCIFIGKGGFCGATRDPSGASLPRIAGPWRFLKRAKLSQEKGIDPLIALREIKANGHYLITSENLSKTFGNA
jgi:hypothetical protein